MKVKVNNEWVDVPAFKVAEKSPLEEYLAEVNAMMADNCLWIERDSADNEVQWYEGTTLCSSETDSNGAWVGKTTIKKYYNARTKVRFGTNSGGLAGNPHIIAIHSLPYLFFDEALMNAITFNRLGVEYLPPLVGCGVGSTQSGFKELKRLVSVKFAGIVPSMYQLFLDCTNLREVDFTCALLTSVSSWNLFCGNTSVTTIKLGKHFFDAVNNVSISLPHTTLWSAESIYESLYTNQEGRNTDNTHITLQLAAATYNRLTAQQIADINSRGFTLTK